MYYNPDFDNAKGATKWKGIALKFTDKALKWLKAERDESKPFMLMVQHKAPHREWSSALKYLNSFDEVSMPEPETFDDYEGRGHAARNQDMSIEISMELGKDLKVKEYDKKKHLAKRIHTRMTEDQLKAWNAAYEPKNQALPKAKPKGKDLIAGNTNATSKIISAV